MLGRKQFAPWVLENDIFDAQIKSAAAKEQFGEAFRRLIGGK